MSVRLMTLVWDRGPVDPVDRYILLAIADNANDEGAAYPSIARIAEKTCYSVRTVMRSIQTLEADGWLTVERRNRGGRGSQYEVVTGRFCARGASSATESHDTMSPDKVPESHLTSDSHDIPPAPPNRKNRHRTVNEPLRAASQRAATDDRHGLFREALDAYFQHKNNVPAPWDGKEAAHLARWLKANPTITLEQWKNILRHRARSPVNHALALSAWLSKALTWLDRPQDEWGREPRDAAVPHSKTAGNLAALQASLAGTEPESLTRPYGLLPAGGAGPGNA